jgi:hypothetical protein
MGRSSIIPTMSKKIWKDHLLSSGVPLEYSVIRIFEELGIRDAGEFCYERKTAEGVPQIFSVDVHSMDYDIRREFWIECLVECKYRHDGTKWVFVPQEYGDSFFGPDLSDLFVTLDQCCLDRKLDRSILAKFEDKYPLCAKGIELLPDDANPKTIEQAIQQLRYAVVAKAMEAIDHQLVTPTTSTMPIWVIVPIIVTTAELWRLKVGTTVEDVRNAEDIAAVADLHDVLVLLQKPDNLNQKDTSARFNQRFTTEEKTKLDVLFKQTRNGGFARFSYSFSTYTPSMFIVISYKRVKSAMKNLHSFFANDRLVTKRTQR